MGSSSSTERNTFNFSFCTVVRNSPIIQNGDTIYNIYRVSETGNSNLNRTEKLTATGNEKVIDFDRIDIFDKSKTSRDDLVESTRGYDNERIDLFGQLKNLSDKMKQIHETNQKEFDRLKKELNLIIEKFNSYDMLYILIEPENFKDPHKTANVITYFLKNYFTPEGKVLIDERQMKDIPVIDLRRVFGANSFVREQTLICEMR